MGRHDISSQYVENHFGSMYLTVIALIQGIALATIAEQFFAGSASGQGVDCHRYVFSGLVVFAIWHHFMYGAAFLNWWPSAFDSFIPFGLGASEFAMIQLLNNEDLSRWILATVVLGLFASAAYLNAAVRIRASLFSHLMSDTDATMHVRHVRWCHGVASTLCLVLALCAAVFVRVSQPHRWLMLAPYLLGTHIVVYEFAYTLKIKPFFRRAIGEADNLVAERSEGLRRINMRSATR